MKQYGTLAKTASLIMLCMAVQSAHGFTIISFDGKPARWENGTMQIEYDPNFGSAFDSSGCDSYGTCTNSSGTLSKAIKSSINTWKNVEGISLEATIASKAISGTPSYDGKNQIKFYNTGWQSLPFTPPTSALAVTISTYNNDGKVLDADIFFNGEFFDWGVVNDDRESNLHDVQNVLTHEMGHFFGLDHSSENSMEADMDLFNATMFYASLPGETFRRDLDKHDVWGIKHLYTNENMPQPEVDEISPNQLQVNYGGSSTVEIYGNNFGVTTSVVLARNTDAGDIVGRVISVEDNKIEVAFDVSTLQSGEYDVVVANSYESFVRFEKGMLVENSTVIGTYNNDSSGGGGGCQSNGSTSILLFLAPMLLILPRRIMN